MILKKISYANKRRLHEEIYQLFICHLVKHCHVMHLMVYVLIPKEIALIVQKLMDKILQ